MPKIEDKMLQGEQGRPFLPDPVPTSRLPPELQSLWELAFPPTPAPWPPQNAQMPVPPPPEEDTDLGKQIKKDMDMGVGIATPFGLKSKLEIIKSAGEKILPIGEWWLKHEEEDKKKAKEPWKDLDSVLETHGRGKKDGDH